ncbi:Os09g0529325 [Oryza sativa Japonica Group]|uniref:Os09g0529325 protein n=1 Tax=Oryza sativa subsp. japonica TaxID=39947 RepID=A0A0P0XQL3_ORYSJ|nr:hypothetical protein EE612_049089 [Oryza sativa]BAT09080.1 Os09g0529325 [Oryza sativa Japonica Group]
MLGTSSTSMPCIRISSFTKHMKLSSFIDDECILAGSRADAGSLGAVTGVSCLASAFSSSHFSCSTFSSHMMMGSSCSIQDSGQSEFTLWPSVPIASIPLISTSRSSRASVSCSVTLARREYPGILTLVLIDGAILDIRMLLPIQPIEHLVSHLSRTNMKPEEKARQ